MVDVAGSEVSLADVFIEKKWSACRPRDNGKFPVQHIFWDAAIRHACNMAESAKAVM